MTTLGGRAPAGGQKPICRVGLSPLKKNATMVITTNQIISNGSPNNMKRIAEPIASSNMP